MHQPQRHGGTEERLFLFSSRCLSVSVVRGLFHNFFTPSPGRDRLLLKAPEIVILDEATAHLDSESEAAIQGAFETALRGRTSIVIAHRLSTILKADQILVVNEGRIVERGTHAELLERRGLYAELYRRQFAEAG